MDHLTNAVKRAGFRPKSYVQGFIVSSDVEDLKQDQRNEIEEGWPQIVLKKLLLT